MTPTAKWLLDVLNAAPRGKTLSESERIVARLVEKTLPEIEHEIANEWRTVVSDLVRQLAQTDTKTPAATIDALTRARRLLNRGVAQGVSPEVGWTYSSGELVTSREPTPDDSLSERE